MGLRYHRLKTIFSHLPMAIEDPSNTKRLVILAIDDAWRRFRDSFNELRSEDILEPGACGDWSVNEVLWHISAWESLLMEALDTPDDGYDYPEPDPDDFNSEAINGDDRRATAPSHRKVGINPPQTA